MIVSVLQYEWFYFQCSLPSHSNMFNASEVISKNFHVLLCYPSKLMLLLLHYILYHFFKLPWIFSEIVFGRYVLCAFLIFILCTSGMQILFSILCEEKIPSLVLISVASEKGEGMDWL